MVSSVLVPKLNEGDILIGKITPKGETDPTPEEKLFVPSSVIKPVM